MTVTISRLYDIHNDAQQAVRRLEAAGVPHSDISLVANNSDGWFNTGKKDRDHDGVDDRAEGTARCANGTGARSRRCCAAIEPQCVLGAASIQTWQQRARRISDLNNHLGKHLSAKLVPHHIRKGAGPFPPAPPGRGAVGCG
jgi:hypothetical protein